MNLTTLSLAAARQKLDAKEITAVQLAQAYVDAIREKDGEIHAYLEVFDDVVEQAQAADARIAQGETFPMLGIPLAVKDNILIHGRTVSSASKMLEHYRASYDATVIAKLKDQGAVFLGRTNMDEFALGGSTENSAFGPTHNPHDTSRVPGGTSGGSAAAVAAGMALAALGSDTGGSIRQPAAFCGVVGLKPTYGAVSRFGLMAAASSLDQIGPIGKTVADAKAVFDSIRGHDVHDSTSVADIPEQKKKPKVIGVPRAFMQKGVDADVLETFESALTALTAEGYEIKDIEMPNLDYALAAYYIINPAEVSTNLSRYDGVRYGLSVRGEGIDELFSKTRAAGFGPETRRRILVGTFVLSSGYYDAYYGKAMAARERIREDFKNAFAEVDAIAMPTAPTPAFPLGENTADPLAMYAQDIFTVPINIAGVPALSVPCGTVARPVRAEAAHGARDTKQLPVGIQFIGPHFGEETLCTVGSALEKALS